MIPNLSRYVNKTILVSVTSPTEDGKCRPFTLASIEMIGLWLQGPVLEERFLTRQHRDSAARDWKFFVPYSQIACVAIPTGTTSSVAPETSSSDAMQASDTSETPQDTKVGASTGNTDKPAPAKKKKQ